MKINVMREFVRLAAKRNYTKTADELYMVQSVLSRHMISLEGELNVKLFKRDRNSFELTPAGIIVLEDFSNVLSNYEEMLDKIARLEDVEKGELHLGYLYYDAYNYVARIRHVFREKFPEVKLILHAYQPAQLETELLTGKIDVAFLYGVSRTRRYISVYFLS